MAAVNYNSNTVSILLGNGNGTFATAVSPAPATGSHPASVTAGDFNGDGKLDLAIANRGSNSVSILLGNGNGTFVAAVSPVTGTSPSSVITGDFNGDGKLDLATANYGSNTVSVHLGNGNGTFAAALSPGPATGSGPDSVLTGDFNGDGKPDLATADSESSTVSIQKNISVSTATTAASATGTAGQSAINLSAAVTATGQTVTSGTVVFVVKQGTTTVATASGAVSAGTATAAVAATGLAGGTYTIQASYSDFVNGFFGSVGTATLTVSNAAPLVLNGAAYYLRLDTASPVNLDVYTNTTGTGTPSQVVPVASIASIALTATAGNDNFTADFSNGNIVPTGGLSFAGAGMASTNQLTIVGAAGTDNLAAVSGGVSLNGNAVGTTGIGSVFFSPAAAGETLNVTGGTITLVPGGGGGITADAFAGVSVSAGATLVVPAAASAANRIVIETPSLTLGGTIGSWTSGVDLQNNDLVVIGGSVATLTDQFKQGVKGQGTGLFSSAESTDTTRTTTLGIALNTVDGTAAGAALYGAGTSLGLFDGYSPAKTDVLIRRTYFGDANLDGRVDGSDYTKIDNGFNQHLTGWVNGDFNYDNVVDGSDYTLIDNAFNNQGGRIGSSAIAAPANQIAEHSSAATKSPTIFATSSDDWFGSERKKLIHRSGPRRPQS